MAKADLKVRLYVVEPYAFASRLRTIQVVMLR